MLNITYLPCIGLNITLHIIETLGGPNSCELLRALEYGGRKGFHKRKGIKTREKLHPPTRVSVLKIIGFQ
jgi:hypothetical protein